MENHIFEKALSESKATKKIIGIRMHDDSDDFWCGYVVDYNSEIVIIQHFTRHGMKDGLIVESIENIESIDSDDDYSLAFEYLTSNHDKLNIQSTANIPLNYSSDWKVDILTFCKTNKILIAIGLTNDSLISGFVKDLNDETVEIRCIGKLGETEALSYYRIEDIETIRVESMEDRKRKLLYDWNNQIKK
jgi:hypothetical protein